MSSTTSTSRSPQQPARGRSAENHRTADRRSPTSMQPGADLLHYVKEYARQKPAMAALCCFGLGFLIGWKLKPW